MSIKKKNVKKIPVQDLETGGSIEEADPVVQDKDTVERIIDSEELAIDETSTAVDESDKLDDLEVRLQQMTENWQRERANFANYKKRVEEERSNVRKFAYYDLAFDLLRVIDYFESSVSFGENIPEEARNVILGVEYTLKELVQILSAHGITPIDVNEGDQFDSSCMEAVETCVKDDVEADRILDIQRIGWRLHDRILRPATVVVSKGPDELESDEPVKERGDNGN